MREKESVQGKGGKGVQFLIIPIPTAIFAADTGASGTLLTGSICSSCPKGLGDEEGVYMNKECPLPEPGMRPIALLQRSWASLSELCQSGARKHRALSLPPQDLGIPGMTKRRWLPSFQLLHSPLETPLDQEAGYWCQEKGTTLVGFFKTRPGICL